MRESGDASPSLNAVMTFCAAGEWLGVPVHQMDRVAMAPELHPVPLARRDYLGLFDDHGELVPVLHLGARDHEPTHMVAILQVRGEPVGLAITAAGRVYDADSLRSREGKPPVWLAHAGAKALSTPDRTFWLIDPDRLWPETRTRDAL